MNLSLETTVNMNRPIEIDDAFEVNSFPDERKILVVTQARVFSYALPHGTLLPLDSIVLQALQRAEPLAFRVTTAPVSP